MKIQKYKGVRDFYPEEQLIQNYIYDTWKAVAKKSGYNEIDTSIIEPLELFTAKSGEEIKSQLYNFTDKGGREITLRPETTPSVARLVVAKQRELRLPIKWFSVSTCFRYEAPQAGRLRNFIQFNADCLGLEKPMADAENIALATNILRGFGLNKDDFFIRLSQRKLINSIFENLKINKGQEVFRLIDKKQKMSNDDFIKGLSDIGLDKNQIEKIGLLFTISSIENLEKSGLEYDDEPFDNIKQIIEYLNDFGLGEFVKLDLSIVRGFDYYTGAVFELYDKKQEFRALAGGGRYDDLVGVFDGERCPGIGFGMGDVVLGLLLEKRGLLSELKLEVDYFVGFMGENSNYAAKVAGKLREAGNSVEVELSGRNLKKQMTYANNINAKNLIIIGDDEVSSSVLNVKNMATGDTTEIKFNEL